MSVSRILGFGIRTDLAYDLEHHLWVDATRRDRVRVGLDPLGVETSGTLAQLVLEAPGADHLRGEAVGSLEAEKYVGPVITPLSGRLLAANHLVAEDPGLVGRDPYGEGWLFELAPSAPGELADLLAGEEEVRAGFEERIRRYRIEGVLAE
jgi:glycine cleavage system H protein